MSITVPTVNISEFTRDVTKEDIKHTVSGDGIFDDMMETATKHLQAQFEGNRIRGEMYAQAYIQIYIETLRTAMQIWLQKPEQDAKVALLEAQKANTEAQTLLLGAQKDNTEADTLLKGAQKLLIDAQKALTTAQATHEPSKKANTEADTLLKQAQREYILAQKTAALKDEALKDAQTKSEEMKANLYKRQIEGFDEDFKQKLLKIGLDSWAVAFSVAQEVIAKDVSLIPKAMKTRTLDSLWDEAIAPDVDVNIYDSRNVTTTSSSELLAQEPNYKTKQTNYVPPQEASSSSSSSSSSGQNQNP